MSITGKIAAPRRMKNGEKGKNDGKSLAKFFKKRYDIGS